MKLFPESTSSLLIPSSLIVAATTTIVLPYFLWICVIDKTYMKDGRLSKYVQRLKIWKRLCKYFNATINLEEKLDHDQQYIFAQFPHGAMSIGHLLTFTNGAGFLDLYNGDKRDLAATGLFYIPLLRDLCILLGCVDASKKTAVYNLKAGRSILIFVGGEKEQLNTKENEHKIYLKNRKGFVKLALEHNCKLVPMYVYGENEVYVNSQFGMAFRNWLQRNFQIGLPIVFHLLPKKVGLHLEIGKPLDFIRKNSNTSVTDQEINEYHDQFCQSIENLFNNTKHKYGVSKDRTLQIL